MKQLILAAFVTLIVLSDGAVAQSLIKAPSDKSVDYKMVRVRKTKLFFPRLTSYHDPQILKEVNHRLYQQTAECGCQPPSKGKYHLNSKVTFAKLDIFSIYAAANYYCGGPYPTNNANLSITFDLKTGKQIEFAQLFKNYETDKEKILSVIFAAQIQHSEKIAAKLKAEGKDPEASCEGDPDLYSLEHLLSDSFDYNFSALGLEVQPQWPHIIEACSKTVSVPYKKLRRYAAPDSILLRVTK